MQFDKELLSFEAGRKLFHTAWAIMPALYYFGYPRDCMLTLLLTVLLIWAGLEVARKKGFSVFSGAPLRDHEKDGRLVGTFFQIASMFLAVLLFDRATAVLAMLFCCIGDSVTACAGALLIRHLDRDRVVIRDFGRKSWPQAWTLREDVLQAVRHRKSRLLMAVMFVTCATVGFLVYPDASPALIAAGASGAVVADAFAWRVCGLTLNDDFTITLASGGAISLAGLI
jgi:dolichol kinase